jgi:hypothetical protein
LLLLAQSREERAEIVGFRRIVALPLLAGLAGATGVVVLGATTFADPAPETPAVGGQLLDPNALQIVLAPPAHANTAAPPSADPSTTTPSAVEPFAVTPPTPPAAPGTEPEASSTTSPPPPNLVTDALTLLGLPTTPCSGPQCDETDVGCTGDSPVCFQFRS